MKKFFIIIVSIIVCYSCKEKTQHDYIIDAFEDYVKTDFGDPKEYIEVTSVEVKDTIKKDINLEIISKIEPLKEHLSAYKQLKLDEFKRRFNEDKTFIVTHELKVRIERNGRKSVVTYYVIDDCLNYKVQDHTMLTKEAPELYREFIEFVENLLE